MRWQSDMIISYIMGLKQVKGEIVEECEKALVIVHDDIIH